jgi:hypothetical protein
MRRQHTVESEFTEVELIDEYIDYPDRVVLADILITVFLEIVCSDPNGTYLSRFSAPNTPSPLVGEGWGEG